MIMIMIMIVFRVETESLYTRSITYNNTQIKLSSLIIITLNTLIMEYKSEVIKLIV